MREKQIQDAFEMWLRERDIPFVRSRMDKASTIAKGWPDFTVLWCGRVTLVEVKTANGKLSQEQKDTISFLERNACPVTIARSVEECVEACRNIFCERAPATGYPEAKERHQGSWPESFKPLFQQAKDTVAGVGMDNGHKLERPADGRKFYIKRWNDQPWVCEEKLVGPDLLLRAATSADLINYAHR